MSPSEYRDLVALLGERFDTTSLRGNLAVLRARMDDIERRVHGAGRPSRVSTAPNRRRARATIRGMENDRRPPTPESLPEPFRSALAAAVDAWIEREGLISIVLFGSVARREAGPTSDIDVLLVAEGLPRSLADRRRPFLHVWERERVDHGLQHVEWNLIVKTPDEAKVRSPLYLDLVEDAVLILDRDGFFAQVLAGLRARMRELGSRRIRLSDGSWYWDLKPDFRFGEVVEI